MSSDDSLLPPLYSFIDSTVNSSSKMPYESVVKALYSYEAADNEEIGFEEDELLCIVPGETADNWYLAHRIRESEHVGLVPANYVEPVFSPFHVI